jgi:RNA polymerase sigma-70 factor (ECF subfamily)
MQSFTKCKDGMMVVNHLRESSMHILAYDTDSHPLGAEMRDTQMTDRQLIALTLQGRAAAFDELVRKYQKRLHGALCRLLHNTEDAQDMVQEGFLLAYQSLHTFQQHSEFYTWLYRIAVNAAMTMKRRRRPVMGFNPRESESVYDKLTDNSRGSQPEHRLEDAERRTQLQQALSRLNPRDRTMLVMKDLEGQPYKTIAKRLGIPFGTVRSRLHRARIRLRRVYEELQGDPYLC